MEYAPARARELVNALGAAAEGKIPLDPRDAADAHNYICALEDKVVQLHRKNLELVNQIAGDAQLKTEYLKLATDTLMLLPVPPIVLPAPKPPADL